MPLTQNDFNIIQCMNKTKSFDEVFAQSYKVPVEHFKTEFGHDKCCPMESIISLQ